MVPERCGRFEARASSHDLHRGSGKIMAKSEQAIRVMMADDHMIFRQGVRRLLEGEHDISIVGEAANGNECVTVMAKLRPDILLLDLNMPDKDGLAVLQEVNFDSLPTHVIVLAAAEDDRDAVRAMRLGARGIVLKQSASDLLVRSIRRVYGGEIWLDNRITAEVMNAFSKDSNGEKPFLTDREEQVALLVVRGHRNKDIGENLRISEHTVRNHLHNIFDKLGVSDRLESRSVRYPPPLDRR